KRALAESADAAVAREAAAAEQVRVLAEKFALRENELAALRSSGAWAIARLMHRARTKLAPAHSRRHRAVRLALQATRVWRREGPGAFARKTGRRMLGFRPALALAPTFTTPAPLEAARRANAEGEYAGWIAQSEPDAAGLDTQRA